MRFRSGHALRLFLVLPLAATAGAAESAPLEYGRDVRPILAENCFHCHGQDSTKRMAGLRLDNYEGATANWRGRAALAPGKPQDSVLYLRITAEQKTTRMPPAHSNRTLSAEQIGILKRWIEEGGRYSEHWAFLPPVRPIVPETSDRRWGKGPLDAFVLKRLETERLKPRPPASPRTWLRRVSLDLTGLPPAPSDLDTFEKNVRSRGEPAYAAAVDRLLESPSYGERMAMDWLDVARYADTHGFNNDAARSMWRWRDWVIESLNANMPYDRFLTEQLAGDLLPNPTLEQRIATGYGRNHVINSEGGIIDEEYRVEYVADRVRTLGMSWVGLTLECARCHDHKYDPITQRDYYRFFAFFNNMPEIGEDGRVANAVPFLPAPTMDQQRKMKELEWTIAKLSRKLETYEQSFKWRRASAPQALAIAGKSAVPGDAALRISCESESELVRAPESRLKLSAGIEGTACRLGGPTAEPQTPAVNVSKRVPMTFSAWLRPAAGDTNAPLLSAIDYSKNPASTAFGSGIELRLVGGELEFRFGDRFPAYSIRVRSEGAGLVSGEWRHVALVYAGATPGANRAHASWVRIFADGREVPVSVQNDGTSLPEAKKDTPAPRRFRIGWDNSPQGERYAGELDAIEAWTRMLDAAEIRSVFERRALPYAVARRREQKATPAETGWLRTALLRSTRARFAEALRQVDTVREEWLTLRRESPTVMVMQEMERSRQTYVLLRGSYNAPGAKVEPGVPEELLGAWPSGAPRNRLGLARWLTKPDHPLTARVVVNRFWQQLFGQGMVRTSENLGVQGEFPSHPELLDWLAREFIDSGWNVKSLLRQIVLSATYRQDSAAPPELIARDPENRLLSRGPRFRLPAEVIRDQALSIAGILNQRVGGPSVYPYQPADLYKGIVVAADYPGTSYVESKGADLHRRSLYTFWKRTVPHPTMVVFDAPDREFCIVRRSITNTPLQALTLLNDPIYVEAARKFAERMLREGGLSPDSRLAFGFQLATGRAPDEQELRILRKTLDEMLEAYQRDEQAALSLLAIGAAPRASKIAADQLAAYTAVANMILNLDEVVTKG